MTQDAISTQCAQIKAHLQSGRSITPLEALDLYGCFRLGARIYDLRKEGMDIERQMRSYKNADGKRVAFAEYRMGGFNA